MRVHLVGGFTGGGKTTAIENARQFLSGQNIVTASFADKEEEYFHADCPKSKFGDTADYGDFGDSPDSDHQDGFARATGCFCCNYTQLDQQIDLLKRKSDQSALFADYGGTCTNLISTLLKPLKDYRGSEIEITNFSTFTDAKLLLYFLRGMRVPLSLESKYIWDKHLEEAEILVINKTDLLSEEDLKDLKSLAPNALPSKKLLFLNALDLDSIRQWVELISKPDEKKTEDLHAKESNHAWLDEEIQIVTEDDSAMKIAYDFMNIFSKELTKKDLVIEHLKFLLYSDGQPLKLSHTDLLNGKIMNELSMGKSNVADLMINARIQTSPEELRNFLFLTLNRFKSLDKVKIVEKFISYFE